MILFIFFSCIDGIVLVLVLHLSIGLGLAARSKPRLQDQEYFSHQ